MIICTKVRVLYRANFAVIKQLACRLLKRTGERLTAKRCVTLPVPSGKLCEGSVCHPVLSY